MIVKRLRLKNVRSHKDAEIEFKKGITIISGRTGSGKSSILMAIEYALFGSSAVPNPKIMRRGSKQMLIELEFEHNGKNYTIIRGLKRGAKTISIDFNNLKVIENGRQLNALSRANDINEIVKTIMGVPEGVKPYDIFQITSYTKQDEIRKLLEMRKEERQEHIDRILQLSKYKTTYENLKEVLSHFSYRLSEIERIEEFLGKSGEELEEMKKRLEKIEKELEENEKMRTTLSNAISVKNKAIKELEEEINSLKATIDKNKRERAKLNEIEDQLERNRKKAKEIEIKLGANKEIEEINQLRQKISSVDAKIRANRMRISELREELKNISNLGAKCPLCKQPIDANHKKNIVVEINGEIERLDSESNRLKEELNQLKLLESKSEEQLNAKKELNYLLSTIRELEKRKSEVKIVDTSKIEERLKRLEEERDTLSKKEKELYSKMKSKEEIIEYLKRERSSLKGEIERKKEIVSKYKDDVNKKGKIEKIIRFVSSLRTYVKDMRVVIRQRFLNEFRLEFQKKFEEIRNQEDEYSVEVNEEYEPIAYTTSGEKVPISFLSGGEKTSVALAYRLALSDLAAKMSNIAPSQLLILDEPTTGFDDEDVKMLPEALKNITSIPQIIIVTHEESLKEIADHTIEIRKEKGRSIISTL